ncbi:hypothetical protein QFZ32_007323 [Streptomyces canus]|uniref:Prevent-host-death protein n=2 Tax=Streptomyces canus TaxID=58343 RepID=A0AAW8FRI8_9ACTN|nr:hypothetical protein [Streptomyces canus]MDQ0911900.1 hypothetical protein [Streptomyces canus]MDQ1071883.1 hypothetical protein [Streptomyces canus]
MLVIGPGFLECRSMPVHRPETVPITLAEREIRLITDVLRHAAAECSAVTTPSEPSDAALDGGVTLGRLTVQWQGIVGEQMRHEGTGLLSVSQNREAWYQVRAALSDHAAQASRDVELAGLDADAPARRRAHDALLLADRIAEASHGW